MKNTILLLLVTSSFLGLWGCSKDNGTPQDQLPPISQTGANTAGCIINGKIIIPKNGSQAIGGSPLYGLNLNTQGTFYPNRNGYWQLEIANKKDINGAGIIIWIKNMSVGNGDYLVDQSNGELYSYGPNNNQIIAGITENGTNKTYWSRQSAGIIKITRSDLGYGIAMFSGTFNCTLYNKDNPNEIIQITDGRFDINALTLNH